MTYNILLAYDADGFYTIWVNNSIVWANVNDITMEDVLFYISTLGVIYSLEFHSVGLSSASVNDIPRDINDIDALKSWYTDFTGDDLLTGY